MSSITPPLPVGVGYGVVVGIGFFFAAVMCGISQIQASLVNWRNPPRLVLISSS